MKQKILKQLVLAFCLMAGTNAMGQATSLTVDNQTPGWLSSKIGYGDQQTVKNLKVTGYLNADDLKFIAKLMAEQSLNGRLDLEDANIVGSTSSKDNYFIKDSKIFYRTNGVNLKYFSYPKTMTGGDSDALRSIYTDTLFINTITEFTGALGMHVKNLKIGENVTVLKYPSFKDIKPYTSGGKIESIEFPPTLKEIREQRKTSLENSTISCSIKNGKNFKEFPSLERLVASFSVEEMPDSVFLPNIKVLSLNQSYSYNSNSMFKSGMHVFMGELIDTLTNMSTRGHNIHLHFASSKPPVMEGSITYHYQLENYQEFILYVPVGSADAYRACFKNGGTKVTIIEEAIAVTDVALDKHELSLNVGETHFLSVNVLPEKATDKSLKWTSDNIDVAEVNSNGVVTAKKAGKATITVSSVSNPEIEDVCEVTVIQPAKSLQLNETSFTLIQDKDSKQLTATIKPNDTTDKTVLWSSSDENVAMVDDNGLVTAKKAGKATITATALSNEDATATCEVTVVQPVTGITLNETSLTMTQLGEMKQLVANVLPEDASNKEVKWTSSNAAVCSVSESGMVVATGYGEATVIATTVDGGFPASCVVNVTKPSPPITLTAKSYTKVYGEANPTFGYDVEGGELSGAPQIMCEATKESPVGIYPIVITKGSVSNENVTYVNGTLTIEKAYQTLSWEQDLSKVKKYDQVELLATASSGLEVTYTIEGNPICSVVKIGNKQFLDCTGEGEAVIVAVQEGNNNYWQTTKIYKPIVIQGTTGIGSASLELDRDAKIFDLTGNCIEKMQKGVNIVRMSDGTVKKVIVK